MPNHILSLLPVVLFRNHFFIGSLPDNAVQGLCRLFRSQRRKSKKFVSITFRMPPIQNEFQSVLIAAPQFQALSTFRPIIK